MFSHSKNEPHQPSKEHMLSSFFLPLSPPSFLFAKFILKKSFETILTLHARTFDALKFLKIILKNFFIQFYFEDH